MPVTVNVKRYNPEASDEASRSWWQEYQVEVNQFSTVLDTLMQIREQQDGTLGLRCSCRSAICGSCAMRGQRPRWLGLQDQGQRRRGRR